MACASGLAGIFGGILAGVLAGALAAPMARAASQDETQQRAIAQLMLKFTPASDGEVVLSWRHDGIACDSGPIEPLHWAAPHPYFLSKKAQPFPVTIGFAIDETGRGVDIRALEGGYVPVKLDVTFDRAQNRMNIAFDNIRQSQTTRDLMPSLRASRFAADAPQTGCRITYTPHYVAADDLAAAQLGRIGAVPGVKLAPAWQDRLGGGDCNAAGWPATLQRGFPDWRTISARDGARKWSWAGFDIDEAGMPVNIAIIASSGHADLDAEVEGAIRNSRFADGARTGCTTAYWRDPATIPAPPMPDTDDFAGYQACTAQDGWASAPRLVFPQSYNERAIEGWAVLAFDAAPDGAIGEVEVLAAQPSEEFGAAAIAVLQSGRLEPSAQARTRCIERVIFTRDQTRRPNRAAAAS
ncbi:MAG: energy transducer TonB [Erythrobacter sp.]